MELIQLRTKAGLEVVVRGRLDSYWSDHLTSTLDDAVHQGSHEITLDLAQVQYMSSAGIRVLVTAHKRLASVDGRLRITNPSKMVLKILEITGLADMLLSRVEPAGESPRPDPDSGSRFERNGVDYSVYEESPGSRLTCRVIGDPRRLKGCRFTEEDATVMSIPATSTVVGLGAFGSGFEACRKRFGEFLAVAGTSAYLPTEGTDMPDYLVAAGDSLPESTLLYGVACDGAFAQLVRFDTDPDVGHMALSEIIGMCMSLAEADTVGLVLVSESIGLAGAALRRSPATAEEQKEPFSHPEIRQWLSFASERVCPQSVVVAAGIATRNPAAALAPMVRPLGERGHPAGHIHAAAFTYSPLRRGRIGLRETVAGLYERERLQAVLHLLRDGRPIIGAGESLFSRGACWIGPIDVLEGTPA